MINIGRGSFFHADCFDVMKTVPDGCIDMILCDLPYGTTACKWDTVLPFEPLWKEYWRICKGAIVLTSDQPFTTTLINYQIHKYRYSWFWIKNHTTGFMNANKMPLKNVEDVCVFYEKLPRYNPQNVIPINRTARRKKDKDTTIYSNMGLKDGEYQQTLTNYPRQTLEINREPKGFHPTQKPVALFEYLIRTYTNEGDLVLDNCAGSGTTAIAAENCNRRWVCIEKDADYSAKAIKRIQTHCNSPRS